MTNGPLPPLDLNNLSIPSGLTGRLKWIILAAILIGLIFLSSIGRGVVTDWLWFGELGFRGIFVKVIFTKVILFIVGFVVTSVLVGVALIVAKKASSGSVDAPIPESLVSVITKVILIGGVLASIILGIIFGTIFSGQWELFLRFTNAATFGISDPVYGRDISFFVFALPMYSFIQSWIFGVGVVCLIGSAIIAFGTYTMRGVSFTLTPALRNHFVIIGALLVLVASVGLWIDRLELVHSDGGVVFGATYADIHSKQPALLITSILGLLTAAAMIFGTLTGRLRLALGIVGLWIILIFALGSGWPSIVQTFTVDPNEFVKEEKFIQRNMDLTRLGYGIDDISETYYEAEGQITSELVSDNIATIENIRLWDYRPLTSVYRQIQLIRPYYDFKDADVDRYEINGEYRQVLLAAREVAPEKLDESAQTWVNSRLYYTHGIGIAMSPVTEFTKEGRPVFFAKDIPVNGEIPISSPTNRESPESIVSNPRIYYGENTLDYVIVNTNTMELDYQTGTGDLAKTNYSGTGGVPVGSWIRKLVYAWEMGDINILISSELNSDSRIQYRRTIQERIRTVAPFLRLDKDPYIVADSGQLFWVQDAYTTSDNMPYSDPIVDEFNGGSYNYIRNSVKVVVSAYDGEIDFYLWSPEDPLARTYDSIFPDLFTDVSEMPESLKSHMRYPQGLFSVQASKHIKYHMENPEHFYGNEDLWAIPQEKFGQGETLQPVEPYYVIMKLPGESREEFVLLIPYTPNDRPNMVGWLAARSDGDVYGKLVAYNFPKDRQVDGPEQVEARIDNDQDISAWFTLRCSEGSTCIRGNLLVIPVGDSILYAEPVYIQAEGVSFPELKKVILATGDQVVMADSLDEAITGLTGKLFGLSQTEHKPVKSPPTSSGAVVPAHSDEQADKIRRSLEILRQELDSLNALIDALEIPEKGD